MKHELLMHLRFAKFAPLSQQPGASPGWARRDFTLCPVSSRQKSTPVFVDGVVVCETQILVHSLQKNIGEPFTAPLSPVQWYFGFGPYITFLNLTTMNRFKHALASFAAFAVSNALGPVSA